MTTITYLAAKSGPAKTELASPTACYGLEISHNFIEAYNSKPSFILACAVVPLCVHP